MSPLVNASTRSGVALLLVLAAVILVLAAISGGLRVVQRVSAESLIVSRELQIEALRVDAETLLQRWCAEHGSGLWTPSQQPQQAWLICDDRWHGAAGGARVSILVWDGLAGAPVALPAARQALRQELPTEWQAVETAGEVPDPLLDEVEISGGLRRWPQVPDLPPTRRWSLDDIPLPELAVADRVLSVADSSPIAALLLAPHSDGRLNLRTAPPALLEAALRAQRRGSLLPALLAIRDRGELPQPPPDLARGSAGLRLVVATDRWHALLRISVGGMERRWWVICAGTDDGVETLQRHAIRF